MEEKKTIEQINKEREEMLAKMIETGEAGLMTEAAYGKTLGDLIMQNDKIKTATDNK